MKNIIVFVVIAAALIWAYMVFGDTSAKKTTTPPNPSPNPPAPDVTDTNLHVLYAQNGLINPNAGIKWSNITAQAVGTGCASLPPELRAQCMGTPQGHTQPGNVSLGISHFNGNGAMEYYTGMQSGTKPDMMHICHCNNGKKCHGNKCFCCDTPGAGTVIGKTNIKNFVGNGALEYFNGSLYNIAARKPHCLTLAMQVGAGNVLPGVNCRMHGAL